MTLIHLKIPEVPKSLNKSLRSNHWDRSKANRRWENLIFYALKEQNQHVPDRPWEKVSIKVTRHFYRMLDYDGCVGSIKPCIDALIKNKIIIDDSYKVTGPWRVDQKFRKKNDGPLLEITVIKGWHA